MKTAEEVVRKRLEAAKAEYAKIYSRAPTALEHQALSVLIGCIREIHPFLTDRFKETSYIIGQSDEIIGELKQRESYNSHKVFLNKKFFAFEYSEAFAVLIHEWGHIFGYDGSRSFTDALTESIALIIENRTIFDNYISQWNLISKRILFERKNEISQSFALDKVERLSNKEKYEVLKILPEEDLIQLLKTAGFLVI